MSFIFNKLRMIIDAKKRYIKEIFSVDGVIVVKNTSGTPITDAGFGSSDTYIREGNNSDLIISNWEAFTYSASNTQPTSDPADKRMWFNGSVDEVDVMIHDGSAWKGYQQVTSDARGFNLSNT